jgi:hypothetical protein
LLKLGRARTTTDESQLNGIKIEDKTYISALDSRRMPTSSRACFELSAVK